MKTTEDPTQQEDATAEKLMTAHLENVDAYLANASNSLTFVQNVSEDADELAAIGKALAFLEKAQSLLDEQFNEPEDDTP